MRKKISVNELRYGMWVSELDRPWLQTPFLFQGFEVQGAEEIDTLRGLCGHVYIDTELGGDVDSCPSAEPEALSVPSSRFTGPVSKPYQDQTSVEQELETAKGLYASGTELVAEMMDSIRLKKKINARQVQHTVQGMAGSIIRNPDAFTLLTKLKTKDSYTYAHSVDVCILALIFGRHLGYAKEELQVLGTGTLLIDVGKMRLPAGLLDKPDMLTPREFEIVKSHVAHSVAIISGMNGVSADIIEIAATHHERINGSGYPKNLVGREIPMSGKIAAIVDAYDAMTSNRVYRAAISPERALRKLYARRDEHFQAVLVEQFIQCVGVYPVGSLVQLSTGEVGVVLSQNRIRRLRPKVMLVLDKNKERIRGGPIIDLMKEHTDASGGPLEITDVLEPGAHGIDPKEFYL